MWRQVIIRLLQAPVRAYRVTLSPWLGHHCRFQPTCSAYALEALEKHGPTRGLYLTFMRLGRCHPWGGHGSDPVPDIQTPPADTARPKRH